MPGESTRPNQNERTPDEIAAGKEAVAREQRALELEKIDGLRQQVMDGVGADELAKLSATELQLTESAAEGFSIYELATLRKLEQTDEPLTEKEAAVIDKFVAEEELRFEEWEILASLLGVVEDD